MEVQYQAPALVCDSTILLSDIVITRLCPCPELCQQDIQCDQRHVQEHLCNTGLLSASEGGQQFLNILKQLVHEGCAPAECMQWVHKLDQAETIDQKREALHGIILTTPGELLELPIDSLASSGHDHKLMMKRRSMLSDVDGQALDWTSGVAARTH
jgi:hypothetical protein